jgi:trans-aconitate methyltransferase
MDLLEVQKRKKGNESRHPWELARLVVINDLLKEILRNKSELNILDIGCGDIFFINQLSHLYPKANFYAIDIAFTDEIIKQLESETRGTNIFLFKTLEEAGKRLQKPADLVLLLDVVEHIEDDKSFLRSLAGNKAIGSNTKIMITVPAYQSLFCSHDHFLGHYRRYTNKTLLATIKSAGFVKQSMGYFFMSLIPPRVLQVLTEKLNKKDVSSGTTGLVEWNKGGFITKLIKTILLTDFYITRLFKKVSSINLPGLSNYIICKKAA